MNETTNLKGALDMTFVDASLLQRLLSNNQIFDDLAVARAHLSTPNASDWKDRPAAFALMEDTLGGSIMRDKYPWVSQYTHGIIYPPVHIPIPSEKGNSYFYVGKLERLNPLLGDHDAEIRHDENALSAFKQRKEDDPRHNHIKVSFGLGELTFQDEIEQKEAKLRATKNRYQQIKELFHAASEEFGEPYYIFHQGFGLMDVSPTTMTATRFVLFGRKDATINFMRAVNKSEGNIPLGVFTEFDKEKYLQIDSSRDENNLIRAALSRPDFYPLQGQKKAEVGSDRDLFEAIVGG